MDELTLPVSEVFGPVWQGEGPHAGRRCYFLRLGHCNLSCEWCDTPYTWDATRFPLEFDELTAEQITAKLPAQSLVVISGGEPLMHQQRDAWEILMDHPYCWHLETNGTIPPHPVTVDNVVHFSVSPKINTRDPEKKRLKWRALSRWAELAQSGRACFKFVATTPTDVDVAANVIKQLNVNSGAVWIMPEGITGDAVLDHGRAIADRVADYGFNFSLRQQVLLYGTERAR